MVKVIHRTRREKWKIKASLSGRRGNETKPRLTVFRSAKYLYIQVVDDQAGSTLLTDSTKSFSEGSKSEKSFKLGQKVAEELLRRQIRAVIFDRGGYKFHGRVKALVSGAREGGLSF